MHTHARFFILALHLKRCGSCGSNTFQRSRGPGGGAFDFWESGIDLWFGSDMYDSFVRYQARIIRALDRMAKKYNFVVIDAGKPPDVIQRQLQKSISALFQRRRARRVPAT